MSLLHSSPARLPAALAVALIRLYQRTLSPDHGWLRVWYPHGACKFHPTCSEYTARSVSTHGLVVGMWRGLTRLIRCHPWSVGGYDPVR